MITAQVEKAKRRGPRPITFRRRFFYVLLLLLEFSSEPAI